MCIVNMNNEMDILNYDWQAKRLDGIILSSDGYLLSLVS